uniref:RxLR effector candidate protein n=1 Tax=Hyaloperonospora arabidopsidis (strain Emoy2) TaxID=559515 RepID=M4BFT7_HYAAE
MALALIVTASIAIDTGPSDLCVPPKQNTLSSRCFGVCSSSLCVNYAPSTAEDRSTSSNDGSTSYFHRGCASASIPTCKTKKKPLGKCEVQCLVDTPNSWNEAQWTLQIAQPQTDTAAFQNIDDLVLPRTLQNLCVKGLDRVVALFFSW